MKRMLSFGLFAFLLLLVAGACVGEEETMPSPLYVGKAVTNTTIRAERSREAESLGQIREGAWAHIIGYEPGWLVVVYGDAEDWGTGYVLRHTVHNITAVADDVLPYGAAPSVYIAVLARDAMLYTAPDLQSEHIDLFTKGTRLALCRIENGWAEVVYQRQKGFVYLDAVEALTPVYPPDAAAPGDTIAAYISFFNRADTGTNLNRIHNIHLACELISTELAPGEAFSFNAVAGPYRKTRGYLQAPSFFEGETVPSYGGGTCQVSSTLYNVLLPLTAGQEPGITILYRVAHGAGGISYLPHGVDAACGNTTIDLRFRNDYPFAVRIDASAQDGVLYIALLKK